MLIIYNIYALLEGVVAIVLALLLAQFLGPALGIIIALGVTIAAQLCLEYFGKGGRLFFLPTIIVTSVVGPGTLAAELGLRVPVFAITGLVVRLVGSQLLKRLGNRHRDDAEARAYASPPQTTYAPGPQASPTHSGYAPYPPTQPPSASDPPHP